MYDDFDDSTLEAAEAIADRHEAAAIAQIRAQLDGEGADDCADCGDEIGEARRAALPSATRCLNCQKLYERRGK